MRLEEENARLEEENEKLRQALKEAVERIKQLEAQLGQNSRNSNWPSSRDKGRKKQRIKSLREKSGKKVGGQEGHQGQTLECRSEADEVQIHRPERCHHCQGEWPQDRTAESVQKRQVIDLPPLETVVTEHQVETWVCDRCGQRSEGEFPVGVTHPIQYGPQIKSLAVYLKTEQFIPYDRSQQFLADVFGAALSPGTLENFVQRASRQLQGVNQKIHAAVQQADVVHFDESGLYIGGRRQWLHSAGTSRLTYYVAHPNRGKKATEEIAILPHFTGTAVHDHWATYWSYENCSHALCNVHHLRDLNAIEETFSQAWARRFKQFLLGAKAAVEQARSEGLDTLRPQKRAQVDRLYTKLVDRAFRANPPPPDGWPTGQRGRPQKPKPRNFAQRLAQHQSAVLAFVYNFKVPFDNNLAERDIRMIKVQQKISGSFRSWQGAHAFCSIRSYISTMRKQNFSVWTALNSLFSGPILQPNYLPV